MKTLETNSSFNLLKMSPHRHPCVKESAESTTPVLDDAQPTSATASTAALLSTANSDSTSTTTSTAATSASISATITAAATSASTSATTPNAATSQHHFVHTKKNNRALIVDNFLFYDNSSSEGLWRCARRLKDNCKKTCRIVDGKVTSNTDVNHSHPPLDDHEIKMYQINHAVKEKAIERPDDKPFLVITSVLNEINSKKMNDLEFNNLRRNACRAKHMVHNDVPTKSKENCLNILKQLAEDGHDLVKRVDDDVVMIARDDDLKLVPRQYAELYVDGTFQYAPRYFKQMYSFCIFRDGFYIPIAHFLVQNKLKRTYIKCIEMLVAACSDVNVDLQQSLIGGHIMMDFEISMINAIKESLQCEIRGCRFH